MRQCGEELKSISTLGLGRWMGKADLQLSSFSIQQASAQVRPGSKPVNASPSNQETQVPQGSSARESGETPYRAFLQGSSSNLELLTRAQDLTSRINFPGTAEVAGLGPHFQNLQW